MPKKQPRNAFYFYMKELEPQLRREGRVLPNGMRDVAEIAAPRWKMLAEKEKERFENIAKQEKARMRGREGDKYKLDNQGNVLAYRKDPQAELKKRRDAERKDMRKDWPPDTELQYVPFYFINFQTLCKTDTDHYLPAEIAIIEYSLEKGITNHLHRFIEPGLIPTGYRFTCIENSESTHQIPVENFDLADSNYTGLWIQIENFINPGGQKKENPPLYCLGSNGAFEPIEYCLEWIHGKACLGEPNRIKKVYEIESLFVEMLAHIGHTVSKTSAISKLTSSDWEYEPDTKCDYHEKKEVRFCALGIVKRWAFAISDAICKEYKIAMTPKHFPMRNQSQGITVLSPSSMPVCNKQESRLAPQMEKMVKKEEQDYTQLRRPNTGSGYAAQGGMSQSQYTMSAARGSAMGPPADSLTRGRGLSFDMQGLVMGERPVGRGAAMPSYQVPAAAGWQRPQAMPAQQSLGIGRGMAVSHPAQFTGVQDDEPEVVPLRLPGQTLPTPATAVGQRAPIVQHQRNPHQQPVRQAVAPQTTNGNVTSVVTKARGADTLMKLLTEGRRPGVPVGRGHTPPNWVDDGSIGPLVRS